MIRDSCQTCVADKASCFNNASSPCTSTRIASAISIAAASGPSIRTWTRSEYSDTAPGPHAHVHALGRQVTVEFLRCLAMLQSPLLQFPSFGIHKSSPTSHSGVDFFLLGAAINAMEQPEEMRWVCKTLRI